MFDKIELKDDDTIFVLGDVIDRGNNPIKILQDMMHRTSVVPLLGNHDYMALRVNILNRITMKSNVPAIYDGEGTREQPHQREIADVALGYVESIILARRQWRKESLDLVFSSILVCANALLSLPAKYRKS